MIKSNYLRFAIAGLLFGLSACAGAAQLPVEEQEPAAVDTASESSVEEAVIEEEAPAEEAVTEVEEPEVDEPVLSDEVAPVEEEAMVEQVASAEENAVAPEEVAAVEEEPMSDEAIASDEGPTPEQQALLASLEVKGVPPELHNEVWLNSDPLKLADLQGKVVIVEFWTFG